MYGFYELGGGATSNSAIASFITFMTGLERLCKSGRAFNTMEVKFLVWQLVKGE